MISTKNDTLLQLYHDFSRRYDKQPTRMLPMFLDALDIPDQVKIESMRKVLNHVPFDAIQLLDDNYCSVDIVMNIFNIGRINKVYDRLLDHSDLKIVTSASRVWFFTEEERTIGVLLLGDCGVVNK